MSSPFPTTFIVGAYIYFVTSLGPKLMENKKPFELRQIMAFYNFSVVALSIYMTYEVSTTFICNILICFVSLTILLLTFNKISNIIPTLQFSKIYYYFNYIPPRLMLN